MHKSKLLRISNLPMTALRLGVAWATQKFLHRLPHRTFWNQDWFLSFFVSSPLDKFEGKYYMRCTWLYMLLNNTTIQCLLHTK